MTAASEAPVAVGADWPERLKTYRGLRLDSDQRPKGDPVVLDSLRRSEKPTVFAFWATYCPPCIEEMPLFEALHSEGHAVVGVALEPGDMDEITTILDKRKVTYSQAVLEPASSKAAGRALESGLPFTLVMAADGTVHESIYGKVTDRTLRAALPSR